MRIGARSMCTALSGSPRNWGTSITSPAKELSKDFAWNWARSGEAFSGRIAPCSRDSSKGCQLPKLDVAPLARLFEVRPQRILPQTLQPLDHAIRVQLGAGARGVRMLIAKQRLHFLRPKRIVLARDDFIQIHQPDALPGRHLGSPFAVRVGLVDLNEIVAR